MDESPPTDPLEPDVPGRRPPPTDLPAHAVGPTESSAPSDPPVEARPIAAVPERPTVDALPLAKGPPQPAVLTVRAAFVMLAAVAVIYIFAGGLTYAALHGEGDDDAALSLQLTLLLTEWLIFLMLPLGLVMAMRADLRMIYSWNRPRLDLLVLTVAMTFCLVGVVQYAGNLAFMFLAEPYDRLLGDFLPSTAERLAETSKMFEADTLGGLLAAILLAAVTPALCEEHFFRGVIQSSLDKRMPPVAAVIVVATIFAAFHFEPVAFTALMLIGLMVGVFTSRTGCILYAVLIHLTNNTVSVLLHNWTVRNVGQVEPDAGSLDSLPVYLFGGALGILAFMARTPRRYRRRWHDGPAVNDPTMFRPGRATRWSLGLARRWRLAAVAALSCSVWGVALDVRDLREMAAGARVQPADDVEQGPRDSDAPRRLEDVPDDLPRQERRRPEVIHVDAGDRAEDPLGVSSAAVQHLADLHLPIRPEHMDDFSGG